MINRTLIVVAAGVVIILAGGLYIRAGLMKQDTSVQDAIATLVQDFGTHIKEVSLLSPHAKEEVTKAYKDYTTPELLQAWQDAPTTAPGKIISSPWPDHLVVKSVTKHYLEYEVEADIVMVSSSGATTDSETGTMPVHIVVAKRGGVWLVSRYQSP